MKRTVLIAAFVLMIGWLSACGGGNQTGTPAPGGTTDGGTTPPAGDAAQTADAQAIFKQNCTSCHGDNLEGRMGGNTNLQQVGGRKSKEDIASRIANGGNGMPPFKDKLTESEVDALADWLAAKK